MPATRVIAGDVVAHRRRGCRPARRGLAAEVGHARCGPRTRRRRSPAVGVGPVAAVAGDAGVDEPRVVAEQRLRGRAPGGRRASGRRLVRNTSAVATSRCSASRSSASRRSSTTLRLPRLSRSNGGLSGCTWPAPMANTRRIGVAAGRLDLDDVGAPVGQDAARARARDPHAQLDDPVPSRITARPATRPPCPTRPCGTCRRTPGRRSRGTRPRRWPSCPPARRRRRVDPTE